MVNRFQVIATTFVAASLIVGTALGITEKADAQRVVTCESRDFETHSCPMNTRNGVRMVRQLSKASCDRNWGYGRERVWVRNGCRAEFVSGLRR